MSHAIVWATFDQDIKEQNHVIYPVHSGTDFIARLLREKGYIYIYIYMFKDL